MNSIIKTIVATALLGMTFSSASVLAGGNEGPNSYFEWQEREVGVPFDKITFQSNIPFSLNANLENPIVYGALYEIIVSPQYHDDSGVSFQKENLINRTQEDRENAVIGDPFYYEQTR